MIDYLMMIMFSAMAFYNLKGIKERLIKIDLEPVYYVALILAGFLYLSMAYKLAGRTQAYILGLLAIFYLFTTIFCQGMARDGIFVLMSASMIRKLSYDDIKDIKVDKNNYKLSIYEDSTIYKQKYKKEDFQKVLALVESFK